MTTHSFGDYPDTTEPERGNVSTLPTVYDLVRKELGKPVALAKTKTIPVGPARPGFALKFSTDLPLEKLDRWRISARKRKDREAIDMRVYNSMVINSQLVAIVYKDEDVVDNEGKPLTFASPEIQDMLSTFDYQGAIKAFLDRDADIIKIGTEVLTACGYMDSENEDEEDPLDSENDS